MTELGDMTHTDKKDLGSKVGKEKKNKNVLLPTNVQNGYKNGVGKIDLTPTIVLKI